MKIPCGDTSTVKDGEAIYHFRCSRDRGHKHWHSGWGVGGKQHLGWALKTREEEVLDDGWE